MIEIFKEDFKFYKSLFTVDEKTYLTENKESRYHVHIIPFLQENSLWVDLKLRDLKKQEDLIAFKKNCSN